LKPSLRIVSLPTGKSSLQSTVSRKILGGFRSNSSQKSVNFVYFFSFLQILCFNDKGNS
jgi:hypothetical protein